MKRLIMMGALGSMLLTGPLEYSRQPRTDVRQCMPTDDLVVKGTVAHLNKKRALLSGKVENYSSKVEYDDARIGVALYDANDKLIGYREFTVGDDIEPGESESFHLRLRNAEDVSYVRYTVICAERPVVNILSALHQQDEVPVKI